ncbi:MAG: GNAT family N-acetyltransferase [Methanomassiliicoccus sp.]|nr:GNAT family N-acetyltransferase [Methanomassiliicoccus sp.]
MTETLIRAADRNDAQGIVDLMTGAMPWPGFVHQGSKTEFWNWRYADNPRGYTNEVVAVGEGKVCAHAASLPTDLVINGKEVRGAQYSDLLTREDVRGRGTMERAVPVLHQLNMRRGVEVEFAFPSVPGEKVVRKAGFVDLKVEMGQYELIANPDGFFENVRFGGLKKIAYSGLRTLKGNRAKDDPSVEVYESTTFPEDIEAMTKRFQEAFTFVLRRDQAYLKWRYSEPRGGRFRTLFARRGGSTAGFIVLRPYTIENRTFMDIVDLVAEVGDGSTIAALVREGARICREEGSNVLQIWLPTDHPYMPDLGRAGFLMRQPGPDERKMKLLYRPADGAEHLAQSLGGEQKCHLVLGDTDWV